MVSAVPFERMGTSDHRTPRGNASHPATAQIVDMDFDGTALTDQHDVECKLHRIVYIVSIGREYLRLDR